MDRYETPKKQIVNSSVRIQAELSDRFVNEASPSSLRTPVFQGLYQSAPDTVKHRLEGQRSPLTGVTKILAELETKKTAYLDNVTKRMLKNTQRLKPTILEAWINNTLADAEHLDVPGCILKPEHRLPLERYGIDRTTLLAVGIKAGDIDRLYRSLFVYSIGFYQMILKILQHTSNKYSVVASFWKVFAILLEYCCHVDYKMIITALNMEKKGELHELETHYKDQISHLEEKEQHLLFNMTQAKTQLQQLQKDLQNEIMKREELEEELMQKGTGHEDEVNMRLQFESKLNYLFAKQRDMETKIAQLLETISEQQALLEEKAVALHAEKKRCIELKQEKLEQAQEVSRLTEKLRVVESLQDAYENRLTSAYSQLEDIKDKYALIQVEMNELLNDNAQKNVKIDDLECELELFRSQATNNEVTISSLKQEKEAQQHRIAELEKFYYAAVKNYSEFEQQLAKFKESDAFKAEEILRLQAETLQLKEELSQTHVKNEILTHHLASSQQTSDRLHEQLKIIQERIEDMNRGRRVIEERNAYLEHRLEEREDELTDLKETHLELKEAHGEETELNAQHTKEIASLKNKIETNTTLFETQKDSLHEKIKSLNEIIASETGVRKEWATKYEQEQSKAKHHLRSLSMYQDKLNDAKLQINSLKVVLEEHKSQNARLNAKTESQLEELLVLRTSFDEASRKNRTYEALVKELETDHKEKVGALEAELGKVKASKVLSLTRLEMTLAEVWETAHINLELLTHKNKEFIALQRAHADTSDKLVKTQYTLQLTTERLEKKTMFIEDLLCIIGDLEAAIAASDERTKQLREDLVAAQQEISQFKAMIPPELRNEPNPFLPLLSKIKTLEATLKAIQDIKDRMKSKESQTDPGPVAVEADTQTENPAAEAEVQTDMTLSHIEELERKPSFHSSNAKLSHDSAAASEFPLRQKVQEQSQKSASLKSKPSLDSAEHADSQEQAHKMRSVYETKQASTPSSTGKKSSVEPLPEIHRKSHRTPSRLSHPETPSYAAGPPPDIKRSLRQAISRRRNDVDFM